MAPPIYNPCAPGTPTPCGENPAFTYTRYPCDFDDPRPGNTRGLPVIVDLKTPVKAEVVNRQREAILAIEAELGIQPSGTFDTVRHRLDAMDSVLCSIWQTVGGNPISVQSNGTTLISQITSLNFIGSGVTVVDHDGYSGQADITIIASFDGYNTDGYVPIQEALPVVSNGQTWFVLSDIPFTNSLELFIEGIKQELGDFEVIGNRVHWTGVQALRTTDIVEVYYSKIYKIGYPGGVDCCATTMYQELFTATAGQTEFDLARISLDLLSTELFIDGISKTVGTDYVLLDGYRVIYSGVPALVGGETVVIKYFENLCLEASEPFTIYRQEVFNPTAGQTSFILSYLPINLHATEVFIDGVSLTVGIDYTVAANVVTYIPSINNPVLIGNEVVVVKYLENESYIGSANAVLNLYQVLTYGNDANSLDITNVGSLFATDGYFDNVVINNKLTVNGLIDPTGLVLDSQISNPSILEANKATIWYRQSDGYVVISDLTKDIVLNGSGTGGGGGSLNETLKLGNTTDGYDIEISESDRIFSSGDFSIGIDNATEGVYKDLSIFNSTLGNLSLLGGVDGSSIVLNNTSVEISSNINTLSSTESNIIGIQCLNLSSSQSIDGYIKLFAGYSIYTHPRFIKIDEYGMYSVIDLDNTYPGNRGMDLGSNDNRWRSLYCTDGYFNGRFELLSDGYVQNDFIIGGKLTVNGLIDPTGLVLDSQSSNPTTPESGKATIWYRQSDGYVVISDLTKDIVLNGPTNETNKYQASTTSAGETVTLTLSTAGNHNAGMYSISPWVKVVTPAVAGSLIAYIITNEGEIQAWAPQDITTSRVLFFSSVSIYSDSSASIQIRFETSGLSGTPSLLLKGLVI